MNEHYCNNCGKPGHLYHQCKMPITSIGIIVFRVYENQLQYLMIRRRDTLGYIDFMRGKYSIFNKDYILNMIKQMTDYEKNNLITMEFDELWKNLWGKEDISNQYKTEEFLSRDKFYSLKDLHQQHNCIPLYLTFQKMDPYPYLGRLQLLLPVLLNQKLSNLSLIHI